MEIYKRSIPKLNPDQERAVKASDKPILIVAGAGTGKTRTLTSRLVWLMQRGVQPGKICALTFTNKAAREMAERVESYKERVGGGRGGDNGWSAAGNFPFIGTFHSLGVKILRENTHLAGRKPNFVIFDDDDSFRLIKKVMKDFLGDRKDFKPADVYGRVSSVKNGMVDKEGLFTAVGGHDKIFSELYRRYEDRLCQNNAFDFDDLILKTVEILRDNPRALERYHERYSHFLVDEYQDINNVQYELVRLLAGKGSNLSVVGDHNQTIYTWRGSNLGVFLNFNKDWPGAEVYFLGENYRSTSNILNAASAIIEETRKPTGVETDRLWTNNEAGGKVRISEFPHEFAEASWIAEEIGSGLANEGQKGSVAAVLYRTNAQSRAIEQALIEGGVPYQIFGGIKFYERKEIKDILAALRLVSNPADELAHERLLKAFRKTRFAKLKDDLNRLEITEPASLITAFIGAAAYFDYIDRNLTNPEDRKENIAELLSFARGFETLGDFLEKVSLLQTTDPVMNPGSGIMDHKRVLVNLMTIHLAKGLEFDRVFIAGANEGVLPHHRSMDNAEQLGEERRLMYVAMTRAKKDLCLSFYDLPSRFLSEIPNEVVEFALEKSFDDEERYIALD